MSKRPVILQLILVLLLGFLWGINWPAVKIMLTEMPPLTIRAVAFPGAALLLAIIAKATGQRLWPQSRDWIPIIVTGVFIIFGFNVLATLGQMLTQASRAAIIAYTMPAITGVLAACFLNEAFTKRSMIALVIGMTGILVLALEDLDALRTDPLGVIVMLAAALSWSIGNVLLKARDWSIPPLSLTVWFFAVSTVVCWPLVAVFEPPWEQSWPSTQIMMILAYHVLGPMVICYAIWTALVNKLPTTIAALSALSAPVVGVISSAVLIGESLTLHKSVALILIVCSVALTFRFRTTTPPVGNQQT